MAYEFKNDMERARIDAEICAVLCTAAMAEPRRGKYTWGAYARRAYVAIMDFAHNMSQQEAADSVRTEVHTICQDVQEAPDENAPARGYAYTVEFTARELYNKGLISKDSGYRVLRCTSGDINDVDRWLGPKKKRSKR